MQKCGWLVQSINMGHRSDEWRLFIDSSKVSLKAVLLHNGNVLPSIPVAHAFGIKGSDDSMKQLLQYIKYDTYKLNICADLKVIALLLGLQLGYTKVNVSTRTLQQWRADTKGNGAHQCVLIIPGFMHDSPNSTFNQQAKKA